MNRIKNIIFDLGAVIIDIDVSLSIEAFARFAPQNEEIIRQKFLNTDFFRDFEKGRIRISEFNEGIRQQVGSQLSDAQIKDAWNALLLTIPQERIDLLKNIKNRYRTFILSNTNVIHVKAIEENYPLAEWVEKVYYSCDMDKRKPDKDIYQQVIQEMQLITEETLFIDDNIENVQTAQSLGISSFYLMVGKQNVIDFFEKDKNGNYVIRSPLSPRG